MSTEDRIVALDQIQAGDILLCVMGGRAAEKVESATGSEYSHAGLCYSNLEVVEMTLEGIQKTCIAEFVEDSAYVAVFRNPDIWDPERIQKLQNFLDTAINDCLRYDRRGAVAFTERKKEHQQTLHEKLYDHFENGLQPQDHKKLKYICSELIVASLIEIGFISPSAAIAYQPDTLSPVDLGRDPTFGHFVGYLKSADSGAIPDEDEFAHNWRLDELEIAKQGLALKNFDAHRATYDSLRAYCAADNRLVPMPPQWNELYGMLRNTRQMPSGGWEPPLPLILAAWHHSTPIEKQLRFVEHLQWAENQNQLEEVAAFLRSLPETQWCHFGE